MQASGVLGTQEQPTDLVWCELRKALVLPLALNCTSTDSLLSALEWRMNLCSHLSSVRGWEGSNRQRIAFASIEAHARCGVIMVASRCLALFA